MAALPDQDLTEEVTCQQCHKLYSSPKLLPCLHAFCKACLTTRDGLRDREGLKYAVDCPLCSEVTELPKNGLDSLPDAHFKQRMVRLHSITSATQGKGHVECEECHNPDSQATACCTECGLICSACLENHRVMRSLSTHKTHSINGVKKASLMKTLNSTDSMSPMTCEKHTNEKLKMYCSTCKRLICSLCMLDSHKQPSHEVSEISSSARVHRGDLQKTIGLAKKAQQLLSGRVESIQLTQESLSQRKDVLKTTIIANFQLLHKQLENLQKNFLSEIDNSYDDQLANISEEIQTCSSKVNTTGHLIKMGEQAVEHTSDIELLALKRYMNTRLKEMALKKPSRGETLGSCTTESTPTALSSKIMELARFHIQHNMCPSLDASHASGMGIRRAEVGKEALFKIHSQTDAGDPCIEKQSVQVEIIVPRTGDKLPAQISPGAEIGTFDVSFVPKRKGEHSITIRIEGNEITRSPYSVAARGPIDPWKLALMIDRQEWPWGVACDANREIYVTRNYHHIIAVFNQHGKYQRKIGIKGQNLGGLWHPTGIAVDQEGNIYVADGKQNGRLQKFSKNGHPIAVYSKLCDPQGVLLNKKQNSVYVCDRGHQTVVLLDTNLEMVQVFGELDHYSRSDGFENVSGHLMAPHSITEGEDGSIFVSDMYDIHVFNSTGEHLRRIQYGGGQFTPTGIAIDGDLLYVCNMNRNSVLIFNTDGDFIATKGGYGKLPGQFNTPTSLAVDYDGYLCVTDFSNHRVQVF